MSEPLVVFTPSGKRGRFPQGTPILTAARKLGVDIDSVCGGRAICGRCQVTVAEGEFAKHGISSAADHLGPVTEVEQRYGARRGLAAGRRLSCQALLQGDVVIDVPPESQVHKQVVRKRAEVRAIELDPAVRLHFVEVEEPDMHRQRGDFERMAEALASQWGLGNLTIDLRPLQGLQRTLRKGAWKVTVAVHGGNRIIAIRPGYHDKLYGLAVDIGSTTIAAHLCDLATGEVVASTGMMNPQIRFGEDLMSRVSYVMMHPGGEREMTTAVREAINALVGQICAGSRIDPADILELVFVGNPIMHHLLLGIDPRELGGAPFALATDSAFEMWATEIGITAVSDSARVYILPCIAGHVGADAAGVVLSETPYLNEEITLVVDVGTNAEIVLGNRDRLLACSSPTGPAFEGAQNLLRPARRPRCHRARPHRPRHARAPLQGDRLRPLVGRPRLRPRHRPHRRHRRLRLRHHRGPGRDVSRRHHRPGRRRPGRAWPPAPPASSPRAAPSPTSSTPASRLCASRKATSAPSSSPRPPSTPAPASSWTAWAWRPSAASPWPAPSAATSTRSTPWCSA